MSDSIRDQIRKLKAKKEARKNARRLSRRFRKLSEGDLEERIAYKKLKDRYREEGEDDE